MLSDRIKVCRMVAAAINAPLYHQKSALNRLLFYPRITDARDWTNRPHFELHFNPDVIIFQMNRATSDRILLTVDYEDPSCFDKLNTKMSSLGIELNLN
jgi:hypothetical protein